MENTKAMYAWLTGSVESCLRTVSEALKLSCETGIHFWDHHLLSFAACAALSDGDIETANGMIRKIASGLTHARKIDIIFYHVPVCMERSDQWKFVICRRTHENTYQPGRKDRSVSPCCGKSCCSGTYLCGKGRIP
ncbi:hypothetical protein [Candidatus Kuenenia stuttgartiensis]|uniref:hypothetical protein n=1 Tax=Kuenenia stuttgartiensis TaxID=174633 RepID=UPI00146D616C|nr:hypothetical protein [Candidatus Kuenenia stuttgartiensis]